MGNSTRPEMRAQLTQALNRGRADIEALIAALDAEERASGDGDNWTFKDLLAHMASWQKVTAGQLASALAGTEPYIPSDETEFNTAQVSASRDQSWQEVLDAYYSANDALISGVAALSEDDVATPGRFPWRGGEPLGFIVMGNGFLHPLEHLSNYRIEHGDVPGATELQKRSLELIRQLFGGTQPFAYSLYNLACFYAKTGQTALALETLPEALSIEPSLTKWATEDPDLVSLRDEPAFVQMTANA